MIVACPLIGAMASAVPWFESGMTMSWGAQLDITDLEKGTTQMLQTLRTCGSQVTTGN